MPVEKVAALDAAIRPDSPGDERMIEVRLIRTLSAVREGAISIEGAIEEFTTGRTAARYARHWSSSMPIPSEPECVRVKREA